MRELARRGGLKSGEARRLKRVERILTAYAKERGIAAPAISEPFGPVKGPNRSGGSHETDWRCPYCQHFNTVKRYLCAKCSQNPGNGRMKRSTLRERAAEHQTSAVLRRYGI